MPEAKKIRVLQIAKENWAERLNSRQQAEIEWFYLDHQAPDIENRVQEIIRKSSKRTFDLVLIQEATALPFIFSLQKQIEAYALMLDESLREAAKQLIGPDGQTYNIDRWKRPFYRVMTHLSEEEIEVLLEEIRQNFFSGQMGSKLHLNTIQVSHEFLGSVSLYGQSNLCLEGDFSDFANKDLLNWQYNIRLYNRAKELWLEFETEGSVEIQLNIAKIIEGGSQIYERLSFSEAEIRQGINIEDEHHIGYLAMSLSAKGQGKINLGPLHYRDSRHDYGEYLLGGKKIVETKRNQELFYLFHPGDLRPPLNVYFSGYRSAEGFEGFYMMKGLQAPFLLITDPRLEGGSFYLNQVDHGDLEEQLVEIIRNHQQELGFEAHQLTLAGLSMGTFGALYYSSKLSPSHVIVGKPLVNIGTIADKERIVRPAGFPTSLDMLFSLTGRYDEKGMQELNERFWKSFWTNVKYLDTK